MNNPDFSQSAEHVALAKVLADANGRIFENCDLMSQTHLLLQADAAITHLGSGYRLPEANEANAERLARAEWAAPSYGVPWKDLGLETKADMVLRANRFLRALHVAFAEPAEKPEPAPEQKCNCADCNPANWPDTSGWRCGKKPEPVFPGMPAPEPTCPECGRELRAIDATAGVCWRCRRRAPDGSLAESTVAKNATVPCTATSGDHRCELEAGHEGLHESGRIDWEDDARPRTAINTNTMDEAWAVLRDMSHPGSEVLTHEQQALRMVLADRDKAQSMPRDIVGDAERRRERQRLVWEAMKAMGPVCLKEDIDYLNPAIRITDRWLHWRDADEAAAKERLCKKQSSTAPYCW